jgi:hypothetical protein
MLGTVDVAVFIVAAVLVLTGGALVLRSEWAVAPAGRSGLLERLWIILPAAFLVLVLVLSARRGWLG